VSHSSPSSSEAFDSDDHVQVATAQLPSAWPAAPELPRSTTFDGAGRAIAGLAERVVGLPIFVPLAIGLLSRVYSGLLLAVVYGLQPYNPPVLTGFRSPFVAWDAQWYMTIAHFGYHATAMQIGPNGGHHDFAFYPLWPTVLRGGELFGIPANVAGPIFANLLFIAALVVIYLVLEDAFGRSSARWGIALLAFSPAAYVLSMAYSEPLFLFLTGSYFLVRSRRVKSVVRGPLLAALTMAARVTGLAVLVSAGVAWLRNPRDWRSLIPVVAVSLVFAAWWGYIWYLTGDPTGWFDGSPAWGTSLGLTAVQDAFLTLRADRIGAVLYMGALFVAAVALIRRNLELGVYSVVALGLSIFGAPTESMPRHALAAFPVFAFIADRIGRRATIVLLVLFALSQVNQVLLVFNGWNPIAP
jgi:hypothetical protein